MHAVTCMWLLIAANSNAITATQRIGFVSLVVVARIMGMAAAQQGGALSIGCQAGGGQDAPRFLSETTHCHEFQRALGALRDAGYADETSRWVAGCGDVFYARAPTRIPATAMNIRILTVLSLFPFAASLTAQTTISMSAATPIATMTSGAQQTFGVTAQGATIGSYPNNVFQTSSQSPSPDWLTATTIIYPTQGFSGGKGFNFFERATCRAPVGHSAGTSQSAAAAGATFDAHAVMATFGAAPGTAGSIVISWRNNLPTVGSNGHADCKIDIDNDGTFEVSQSAAQNFSFPYTMGASGSVDVLVSNECRSDGDGQGTNVYTWTELYVSFQPDQTASCSFTNYGQGCAGAQLAGNEVVVGNTRNVFFLGTGCYANSPVIVAIGSQQLAIPLLSGCSLLSNADALQLITADGSGNATASWTMPVTVTGTTYVQFLPIANVGGLLAIRASNGVNLTCN